MGQSIQIYDTTLRDGAQGEGVNFSLQDKLLIARRLDACGFDFVEGGYPLSNPKDAEFFQRLAAEPLKHARLCAFGMTRRRGAKPADDPGMKALVDSHAPVITIVGKTHDFHVTDVLRVSLEENLAMIRETVSYLREWAATSSTMPSTFSMAGRQTPITPAKRFRQRSKAVPCSS